ncbi:hypothetical protein [Longimicrobium terrae]|uniref:Uncharacterized protein n=1 Tax=Longimicrobium terrae TaxID=1639882 RepID=A0A841H821_9BACT|nr:hypothetical protein [Longimicrobium terrae]MBB4639677.1 hypothetical protein [Longimicrobium terrae]MBB6074073.1 hypothetical protein [Longimicrobium terrae]NNC28703.1 hypothetical protein [Longimicrobium terrae]
MSIVLTPEVERALADAAVQEGTTPDELADAYLRDRLLGTRHDASAPAPRTLAERLAGYVGVLNTSEYVPGGAQLSENSSEKFADLLLEKRRDGRL